MTSAAQNIAPCGSGAGTSGMADHWQVIVIGAGVAGGLAALQCARAGWKTLLVERQMFPREKVCGCCLNQQALRALESVGLHAAVVECARQPVRRTRFHVGGRSATVRLPETRAISRSKLDLSLRDAFVTAGGTFLQSTQATVLPLATAATRDRPAQDRAPFVPWRQVQLTTCGHADSPAGDSVDRNGAASAAADGVPETGDVQMEPHRKPPDPFALPGRSCNMQVTAEVVLACDGLGHRCLQQLPEVTSQVSATSRIGVGAIVPRSERDDGYPIDELQMAVAPQGYVGTVAIEGNRLNIAAALDSLALKKAGSPTDALLAVYDSAGLTAPRNLKSAHVRGTLPLTQSTAEVAFPRLLLLGDAAGYVEPFTGEGMTWALLAAERVPLIIETALQEGWHSGLQTQWQRMSRQHVGRRQRLCRLLAASLRYPWLLSPMLTACRWFPATADSLVIRMNQSPELQEQS